MLRISSTNKKVLLEIDKPGKYTVEVAAGKGVRIFQIVIDDGGNVGLCV